ncbi:MAG: J domain-containing protein [Armatimonadaceae bacterium]
MGPTYKDYYAFLGVDKTASEKQIKDAYRKLARKYHPDVNPGDTTAEEKFKEISEAYDILSDKDKREKYDQFGDQWRAYSQAGKGYPGGGYGAYPGAGSGYRVEFGQGFSDLEDLFATLFGDAEIGGGQRMGERYGGFRSAPRKGQDVESELTVTLEEAFHGGTRSLTLSVPTGRYDLGMSREEVATRRVEVKIPAGVREGQKIRLSGQGGSGAGGSGDLYLVVKIAPHNTFERRGDDLYVDVAVPYTTAALGGDASVPTLKGSRLTVRIPAGTQSGQSLRLGGQGMPRLRESGNGDLYARIKITVPKDLSDRERKLLEELAALRRNA